MPFHGQGHMNTMLQFAKRLIWKGAGNIRVTLATTLSTTQKMINSDNENLRFITTKSIYDDTDDAKLNFKARFDRFQSQASVELGRLISTRSSSSAGKCLLVYDANLSWALDVAKQQGVPGAAFFTQACAYVASFYSMFLEEYADNHDHPVIAAANANANASPPLCVIVPSPEELERGLPSLLSFSSTATDTKPLHPIIRMMLSHMSNLHLADLVLFNSFDNLEDEVVKWMANLWPVRTIGPTLPSAYLDKRVEHDVDYGFNLFKSNNDTCLNWLNAKQVASVVYVSFGSAAALSVEQTGEIAEALKHIPSSFLWIVRETEHSKLPDNFINETSDKGLVVSWCPQLDVLAHEAVGCFVTHCGWNSTIEALSFGVPMLAMPQFMDQMIDAHFVDQIWGVGVKPKANEKGLVSREEITHCLEEIMHGQRAEKIKENAGKWKALAKEAVGEGGSSDKHIDEIIDLLASL